MTIIVTLFCPRSWAHHMFLTSQTDATRLLHSWAEAQGEPFTPVTTIPGTRSPEKMETCTSYFNSCMCFPVFARFELYSAFQTINSQGKREKPRSIQPKWFVSSTGNTDILEESRQWVHLFIFQANVCHADRLWWFLLYLVSFKIYNQSANNYYVSILCETLWQVLYERQLGLVEKLNQRCSVRNSKTCFCSLKIMIW